MDYFYSLTNPTLAAKIAVPRTILSGRIRIDSTHIGLTELSSFCFIWSKYVSVGIRPI